MKHLPTFCRRPWLRFAMTGCLLLAAPLAAHGSSLRRSAIVRAVADAKPAVVNIHGQKSVSDNNPRRVNGMGAGVIIDERGYIVTNFHVVNGVREIKVTLADGQSYVARLVAQDPSTDLAVIKIQSSNRLPTIRIGTSQDLMEGEDVIAVGNAFGYENTVTRGIISALHRTVQVDETQQYADLIQTDASINPGNSGGPLLNIDGEMIGVNVATRVGAQGIGFAIPVDKAMDVAARLLSSERSSNIWHGIIPDGPAESGTPGVYARSVQQDSPAQTAGIAEGDVITRVNTLKVQRTLDLERAMIGRQPGEEVEVEVNRQGQTRQVRVRLAAATTSSKPRSTWAADQAWDRLGMQLEEVPAGELKGNHQFRGGLRVKQVRAESLAAQQGVVSGDILVGIHQWVTATHADLAYVLKSDRLAEEDQVKFYILRGNNTLFGNLKTSVMR